VDLIRFKLRIRNTKREDKSISSIWPSYLDPGEISPESRRDFTCIQARFYLDLGEIYLDPGEILPGSRRDFTWIQARFYLIQARFYLDPGEILPDPGEILPGSRRDFTCIQARFYLDPGEILPGSRRDFTWIQARFYLDPGEILSCSSPACESIISMLSFSSCKYNKKLGKITPLTVLWIWQDILRLRILPSESVWIPIITYIIGLLEDILNFFLRNRSIAVPNDVGEATEEVSAVLRIRDPGSGIRCLFDP
jgi:hypothetical protein